MDLSDHLDQLFDRYRDSLPSVLWPSEADRWAELLYCLLNQVGGESAERTRAAIENLNGLGLLDVSALSDEHGAGDESPVMIKYTLKHYGFSPDDAERGYQVIRAAAAAVQAKYQGKMQKFLRRHGEVMRDQLIACFEGVHLEPDELRYAVTHWLQNALSIPLSLAHPVALELCGRYGQSLDQLVAVADELDVNVALIDDLVQMDHEMTGPPTGDGEQE